MGETRVPWRLFSVHVHDVAVRVRLQFFSDGRRGGAPALSTWTDIFAALARVGVRVVQLRCYDVSPAARESLAAQIEQARMLNAIHDAGGRDG